jgi:hypothetical protein
MAKSKDMNIHENRLASFNKKRRASSVANTKGAASGKWPHEQPLPGTVCSAISLNFRNGKITDHLFPLARRCRFLFQSI